MTLIFERPPKITFSLTQTCNLQCRHCYGDCNRDVARPELTTEEWLGLIDDLSANGVIQTYIEGGEPFYKEGIFRLLRKAARNTMTLVRTNGTLIDRKVARRLKAIGVGRVLVDVMGAEAATHDWFTGVPGSFEKALDAVRFLVEAGVKTDVLTILTKRNAAEIQGIVNLAASCGAERVGLLRLYPLGRVKRIWSELALSLDEQMTIVTSVKEPPGVTVMRSWHPKDRNCCWQAATVNAFGDSIGCPYLREYVNYGNIKEVSLMTTWRENPLYRQLRAGAVEHSCSSCDTDDGSKGGCRSTAYAFHGRWTAPDPFCSTLNQGVDLSVLPEWLLQENPKSPHEAGP